MNKKTKPAASYAHVTPLLLKTVRAVLDEADKHKYSVSRVYGAHNAAFLKRDQPQTCSSCLRNRVRELRAWVRGYEKAEGIEPVPAATPNTGAEHYETLFTDFMTARGIGTESTIEDQRAALLDFQQQYAGSLPEQLNDSLAELLQMLVNQIAAKADDTGTPYERMVKRLGLAPWDGDAASELATLNTLIEQGYPVELTDEETDAVLTRMDELEKTIVAAGLKDPNAPQYDAPAQGVVRYPMGEGVLPFDFTPSAEDPNKGTVLYADGSKVKASTYVTATGHEIAVQPGGKASIKEVDLT